MSTKEIPLPDGFYPPFAVITENDGGGLIIIACALGLAMVLLFSVIRISVRCTYRQQGPGVEDVFLAAATAIFVVEDGITLGAAHKGFGKIIKLIKPSNVSDIEKTFYADHILVILALGLVKCSVGFFILRITPMQGQRKLLFGILAATLTWMVVSIFAVALQCNLSHPWILIGESCPGSYKRLLGIGIFDCLLELALVSSSVLMIARLQAGMWTKVAVVLVFCFRLPLIVFVAMRLTTWDQSGLNINFTRLEDRYVVWTQVQVSYSLVSATIPSIRAFISSLSTFHGAGLGPSDHIKYGSPAQSRVRSASRHTSIPLSSLKSLDKKSTRNNTIGFSPDFAYGGKTQTQVFGQPKQNPIFNAVSNRRKGTDRDNEEASVKSNDSQQMIIRKKVDMFVEHADDIGQAR